MESSYTLPKRSANYLAMTPELQTAYDTLCRAANLGDGSRYAIARDGQRAANKSSDWNRSIFQQAWAAMPGYIQSKIDNSAQRHNAAMFIADPDNARRVYLNAKRNLVPNLLDVWERDELQKLHPQDPASPLKSVVLSGTPKRGSQSL